MSLLALPGGEKAILLQRDAPGKRAIPCGNVGKSNVGSFMGAPRHSALALREKLVHR